MCSYDMTNILVQSMTRKWPTIRYILTPGVLEIIMMWIVVLIQSFDDWLHTFFDTPTYIEVVKNIQRHFNPGIIIIIIVAVCISRCSPAPWRGEGGGGCALATLEVHIMISLIFCTIIMSAL